ASAMTASGRCEPAAARRGRTLWPVALHVAMRFHDLRHTFATELLRQGVDVHRVQRLMRHSDVRVTTGTYAHLLVEDLRAAVDAQVLLPAASAPLAFPAAMAAAGSLPDAPPKPHAGEQQVATEAQIGLKGPN